MIADLPTSGVKSFSDLKFTELKGKVTASLTVTRHDGSASTVDVATITEKRALIYYLNDCIQHKKIRNPFMLSWVEAKKPPTGGTTALKKRISSLVTDLYAVLHGNKL